MKQMTFSAAVVAVSWAAPASAQPETQVANPAIVKWNLQVAPTLGDPLPLYLGDGLKDYKNTTKLSLSVAAPVGPMELSSEGGVKVDTNLNDRDKSGSAFFLKNELSLYRGFRRLTPFVYANGESGYARFFDGAADQILEYGAGLKLELLTGHLEACGAGEDKEECVLDSDQNMYLNTAAQYGRNDNSNAAKDYRGPKVGASYLQKFSGTRLVLSLDAEYEHKRFDAPVGARRKDDQVMASGSLNFARALFPQAKALTKLNLGARWVKSWSNYEDGRANKLQVLPVLTFSQRLGTK